MPQGGDEYASVKVLFLAANPAMTTRLAIDEEMREIEQKVRATKYRDELAFQSAWAARLNEVCCTFSISISHRWCISVSMAANAGFVSHPGKRGVTRRKQQWTLFSS